MISGTKVYVVLYERMLQNVEIGRCPIGGSEACGDVMRALSPLILSAVALETGAPISYAKWGGA